MQILKTYAEECGISLDERMLADFETYAALMLDWNTRLNLTAITDREGIIVKHFLDSLLLLRALDLPGNASLIDVGTGAGFPGVPLKIVRPDLELTLLDSLQKRVRFLQELSDVLGQQNRVLHGRAEERGRDPGMREGFDIATARAVAALPVLCEYCLPFVRVGGTFAALKGWDVDEEARGAANALKLLGGEVVGIRRFTLPLDNRRSIVLVRKRSQTPPKYPRISAKIKGAPL